MINVETKTTTKLLVVGLILIPIMLIVLAFTSLERSQNINFFDVSSAFFVNYILAVTYFLFVLINNRPFFKFRQIDRRLIIITLILFSISSFSLNNSFVIFSQFTLWVKLYVLLFYSAFLGVIYIERTPKYLRHLIFLFLGAGIVLTTYFTVYLAPIYHISLIGIVFSIGLSIHIFIPLCITISVIVIYAKLKKTEREKIFFYIGIFIPILITVIFLFQWNNSQNEIHKSTLSIKSRHDSTLPQWVLLCQDIPADKITQNIIKGNLVYDTYKDVMNIARGTAFDEVKRHDPLINVGIAILGDIDIGSDNRVKILKSQFNARHLLQRKLWSGENLSTVEVLNNVRVYPDFRLAYTEKTITVKNFDQSESNNKEAAFTFYLPEGSVATSLSLWINGKEEKSRLTTKSIADSAYTSIVGVENRDPALLHWQEGNTLTVTVFPCTPKENRRFKVGITTPLKYVDGILKLQNIYFDGPVTYDIIETSRLVFESENEIKNINVPRRFKKELEYNYLYSGKYKPYWEVSLSPTKLSKSEFSFNNNSYSISKIDKQSYSFNPDKIYLDMNKSWSENEFNEMLTLFSDKKIYVYHDKLIQVNIENKAKLFEILSRKNFSLFPFNTILEWNRSLVISKSTEVSPNLADLEGSKF